MTVATRELRASYAFISRNFSLSRRYWGWELAFLVYALAGALGSASSAPRGGSGAHLQPHHRGHLLELPLDRLQLHRGDDRLGAVGGDPRVHDDGARPTLVAAARLDAVRRHVRPRPHGGHPRRPRRVLRLDLASANVPTAVVVMLVGSFSIIGIGTMAAILPLLYVERGAQMTFVLQSVILVVSGVYYPVDVLPQWMQVLSRLSPATYILDGVRAGLLDGARWPTSWATSSRSRSWARCSSRPGSGPSAGRALREAHGQAQEGGVIAMTEHDVAGRPGAPGSDGGMTPPSLPHPAGAPTPALLPAAGLPPGVRLRPYAGPEDHPGWSPRETPGGPRWASSSS